jgi:hypothetical protein
LVTGSASSGCSRGGIGIAVIGTALFGSGPGGGSGGPGGSAAHVIPSLVHNAQVATLVNLGFIVAALRCTFGLPTALDEGEDSRDQSEEAGKAETAGQR